MRQVKPQRAERGSPRHADANRQAERVVLSFERRRREVGLVDIDTAHGTEIGEGAPGETKLVKVDVKNAFDRTTTGTVAVTRPSPSPAGSAAPVMKGSMQ